MSKSIVVVYSGGMDSYTVLRRALLETPAERVLAVSFDYSQRHKKELQKAREVCEKLGVEHRIIPLAFGSMLKGSALTDNVPVPEGHYEHESMKLTVVPNRNMIMISIAAGIAVAEGARELHVGVHAGDHAIYPDCRPKFIDALGRVLEIANYTPVRLDAPFLYMSKGGILKYGFGIGLTPESYADTWTCYKGGELACGKCGSCGERLEAFAQAGAVDPLAYEAQ